jgi:CRISPR-associated protein Cas2
MNVIVAYDISDNDHHRAHLAALLGSYGVRIQKSVFECQVDETALAVIMESASMLLNLNRDVLHVFPQCQACFAGRRTLGQANKVLHELYWIV